MLWKVPAEVRLDWRTWGETSVVFNRASGDTHLLDALAAEVLKRLEAGPTSIDELCERIGAMVEPPSEGARELSRHIETLVSKLDELGLITSARS